jgi:hypothetical protein
MISTAALARASVLLAGLGVAALALAALPGTGRAAALEQPQNKRGYLGGPRQVAHRPRAAAACGGGWGMRAPLSQLLRSSVWFF